MGRRGPAPAPTQLKIVRGDRSSRVNHDEPVPAQGGVTCPEWVSDEARREVWDKLAPDLIAKAVLTPWDVDAFATLCEAVIINRRASADVMENGASCTTLVRETNDGTSVYELRRNPAWQVARESAALIVTLGGRFGLNPADRQQLKIEKGRPNGEGGGSAEGYLD